MEPTKSDSIWRSGLRIFVNTLFKTISIVLSIFIILLSLGLFGSVAPKRADSNVIYWSGDPDSANLLLSIPIQNEIIGEGNLGGSLSLLGSGVTSGYEIKTRLYDLVKDSSIKGVVLEINSPGGAIFGAKAIAEGVKYYKTQTGKPVYAFISGLAASGAYMAALSSDAIYADYGSSIGSIGVISGPFIYYDQPTALDGGLLSGGIVTQNGIQSTYITAGKYKDSGDPFRKLTNEEIQVYQTAVNNEYDSFINDVSAARKIEPADLRNQIGALIYDNKTAKQYKLIDDTKTREDVFDEVAKKAGIKESYQVIRDTNNQGLLSSILSVTGLKPKLSAESISNFASQEKCHLTSQILAYHGQVARLCQP